MKPLKSGLNLANWMFRISLLLFVILLFIGGLKPVNFSNSEFYISAAYLACGALLFFGGFLPKPSLTIISGLILSLMSFGTIFFHFSGKLDIEIANYLIILAIGFYFTCSGN
jgi:hypothetical protein